MKNNLITVLVLLTLVNTSLFSQRLHKMGLLSEDITKIAKVKKAEIQSVLYKLPSSADNSVHMPPVGNQGQQGCCVAFAIGYYYKTYQEWQTYGWSVTDSNHIFSPAFIYNHINGGQDSGSYFSDAFQLLIQNGCATLAEFPFNDANCTTWPSESVYRDAINYRSSTAYYIKTTTSAGLTTIKQLLAAGSIAVLGINVYENFEELNSTNSIYCVKYAKGSSLGGHAVTIVGYDDTKKTADGTGAFKLINQWGTSWGNAGYFWMSYQAVMNTSLCQGYAYYTANKGIYTPTVIASAQINLSDKNLLTLNFGIGSNSSPTYSIKYFNFYMNTLPHPSAGAFPSTNIDFDLTDGAAYLDSTKNTNIFLSAKSSVTGAINSFSVNDSRVSSTVTSAETPKTIPGNSTAIYVNTNLTPPTVVPVSPLSNSKGNVPPVILKWAKSERATSYRIQCGLDSIFTAPIADTSGFADTSYSISSLTNSKKYYWRVNATNTSGTSSWSTIWNFTALAAAPSAPVLSIPATAAVSQALALTLSWSTSSGASSYNLQVSTNSSFTTFVVNDSTITATSGQVTGLSTATKYYWRVNAKNSFGTSNWSTVGYFTTITSALSAPVLLTPSNNAVNQQVSVKLSWKAPSGAVSYRVQVSKNSSFTPLIINDSTVTYTAGTLSGLSYKTKYYWRVNAKNSSGTSNWSSVSNFTTLSSSSTNRSVTLAVPAILTVVVQAGKENVLYLENYSKADNMFIIERSVGDSSNFSEIAKISASEKTYTDLDVQAGVKYFYRTAAYNEASVSSFSSIIPIEEKGENLTDAVYVIPTEYKLYQNYPNPFNPATIIQYQIPKDGPVTLKIYNLLGREIKTLVNGYKKLGSYSVNFDASGLSSGVYIYILKSGEFSSMKKMMLIK
jgi:hypothetical protein